MANNPSALKRQKQSEKRRQRNRSFKSSINTIIKKVFASQEAKNPEGAKASYEAAVSRLDRAVTKGVLHRKTASRRISRLTRQYRQAQS
ncbi:MAG TPA: 30S ribosomal protein S20 [Deltaproteobacteria bacterium]|nr:30S ribosomal protein S20 [Deltaproteobacteria bacterium]